MVPVCTSCSSTTDWSWSQVKSACALTNLAAAASSWEMTFCKSALFAGGSVALDGRETINPRQSSAILFPAWTMVLLYRLLDEAEGPRVFFLPLLTMGPNPILGHLPARILLLAITVDLHIAGNCLDAPL